MCLKTKEYIDQEYVNQDYVAMKELPIADMDRFSYEDKFDFNSNDTSLLDTLTERERKVSELYYSEGLSQRKIAILLGIPGRTVQLELHRALDKLGKAVHTCQDESCYRINDILVLK